MGNAMTLVYIKKKNSHKCGRNYTEFIGSVVMVGKLSPPPPLPRTISAFVDHICIGIISNKAYVGWVRQQAEEGLQWAVDMQHDMLMVQDYIDFWKQHIEVSGRLESGGMSVLCSIIENALPISVKHISYTVQDCAVTGQRGRPCFVIVSSKPIHPSIFVHHSLLQCCQTLWLITHLDHVFKHVIKKFCVSVKEVNLGKICTDFNASVQRTTLINAMAFVLRDVSVIFTEDNVSAIFTEDNVVCTTMNLPDTHPPVSHGSKSSGKQPALCEKGEIAIDKD